MTLLAYAALPWLLLAVHRGLRDPRGWRWPAAVALLVTASGGGINGAVTAWMLLGPALLLALRAGVRAASPACRASVPAPRDTAGRARLAVVGDPGLGAVLLRDRLPAFHRAAGDGVGHDERHREPAPDELLALLRRDRLRRPRDPVLRRLRTLLFSAPVVLATLLLPAAALTGFVWTRRWRYGPVLPRAGAGRGAGDGGRLPRGNPAAPRPELHLQPRRRGALPARLLQGRSAAGGRAGVPGRRRGGRGLARLSATSAAAALWRSAASLAGLAVLVLAAWPLVTGRAQDAQVSYRRFPPRGARRRLTSTASCRPTPARSCSRVTCSRSTPGAARSTRSCPRSAGGRWLSAPRSRTRTCSATNLLWTIDGLVHQQRLLPGQLPPLLSLIGVRSVAYRQPTTISPAATRRRPRTRPRSSPAARLRPRAARSYGPVTRFAPTGLGRR